MRCASGRRSRRPCIGSTSTRGRLHRLGDFTRRRRWAGRRRRTIRFLDLAHRGAQSGPAQARPRPRVLLDQSTRSAYRCTGRSCSPAATAPATFSAMSSMKTHEPCRSTGRSATPHRIGVGFQTADLVRENIRVEPVEGRGEPAPEVVACTDWYSSPGPGCNPATRA